MGDKNYNLEEKIKNRTNIFRLTILSGSFLLLVFIVVFKIESITISDIGITDITSLLISIFALAMSIAFYFKASDTSNQFYNNTYKFTKDISESIGRMDEKFGEKLKHMDDGYSRFLDSKFSSNLEEEIDKEKSELKKKVQKLKRINSEFIEKDELSKEEKDHYLNIIKNSNEEMNILKNHINNLEYKLSSYNNDRIRNEDYTSHDRLRMIMNKFDLDTIFHFANRNEKKEVYRIIKKYISGLSKRDKVFLRNMGFLTNELNLTMENAYDLIEVMRSI